ncbi:CPBP family intramembrane glutamic endopeptidase [Streptomyces sp. NPDC048172]|uniref:CPBP family intramembrane glutamic endopeptidase n=1 Tax=Streptomyces sp. NPDC048172 TaxID=3365505 RepID=UPI003721E4D9
MAARVLAVFAGAVLVWLFVFHGTPLSDDYDRPTHAARAVLTSLLVVPGVALARRPVLAGRSWTELGLPPPRAGGPRLLLGAATWAVPSALGFALCLGSGLTTLRLAPRTSVAEAVAVAGMLVVLVFLYEALPEELVFRGLLMRLLLDVLRPWQANTAQAALFALYGFLIGAATSPDRLLVFFVFGLVLGTFRLATGNIWAGIGFHLAFQTVAQLVEGDGAAFDVEGAGALGVLALGALPFALGPTLLASFLALLSVRALRRRGRPGRPSRPVRGSRTPPG